MRNDKSGSPRATISREAAHAILARIFEADNVIAKQQRILANAQLDIREALEKIEQVEQSRRGLADELTKFAPDDFMSPVVGVDHAKEGAEQNPPGYGPKPWHRQSAMPQRTYNDGSRAASFAKAAPDYEHG